MSTKLKVILGFVMVIIVLAILAFEGVSTTKNTIALFDEYKRVATMNVKASDLEAAMNRAAFKVLLFAWFEDETAAKDALENLDSAIVIVQEAKQLSNLPQRQKILEEWRTNIAEYKTQVTIYTENVRAISEIIKTQAAAQEKLINLINDIATRSQNNGFIPLTRSLLDLRGYFFQYDKAVLHYVQKQDPALRAPVDAILTKGDAHFATIRNYAGLSAEDYTALKTALDDYLSHLVTIQSHLDHVFASDEVRLRTESELFTALQAMNLEIMGLQNKLGADISDGNASALRAMLIISGVGIAFSLIIMTLIITSLVRILKAVSTYADEVARGHFGGKLTVNEPGEIGMVIKSMRSIPEVLDKVVNEYKTLGSKVVHGYLRDRGDDRGFSGEYAALVSQANTLLDSLGDILDLIPAMVVAYDTDYKITYLNNAATQNLGNLIGESCPQSFRVPLGESTDPAHQIEAKFTDTQGVAKQVAVSATPNVNTQGKVIGSITVLNDITAINNAYTTMIQVAHEADAYSERVVAAAEELSAQVDQISAGTEAQRDQVSSTATAMEEMNSTVMEVAKNAAQASAQGNATREQATKGSKIVEQLIEAIKQVDKVAQELNTNMEQLGTQAEAIGGVMDVISDIADQTNLLALNAAIEAARAGEAGRGFAVVADEVRKLAEKTMSATSEVGSSIQAIQESTKTNIIRVEQAAQNTSHANELAATSGQALQEIVDLANDNAVLISSIATAAEEQSATSEEINRAVDDINQIASETASAMGQSAEAVRELSNVATELKQLLVKLNAVAGGKS